MKNHKYIIKYPSTTEDSPLMLLREYDLRSGGHAPTGGENFIALCRPIPANGFKPF